MKEQSRMDNPDTVATLGTQDKQFRNTTQKTKGAIKNGKSRDSGDTGYTKQT